MAKCGITNIGGGGGIGSDELTATKDYILSGLEYVGADTDDEKDVGIMFNNGTTANQNLNAGGSFLVKGGYHAQPFTVNANSLASQTPGNTTNDKVLNGFKYWSNGVQGMGNLLDYSATPTPIDAIRIMNNRFEVAVVRGLHGYSWANGGYEYMSYDQVANAIGLTAAKLKKGEVVCGRTGTWEGYVPGTLDLYNRGAWGGISSNQFLATWHYSSSTNGGYLRYDPSQIAMVGNGGSYNSSNILINKPINVIPYSYINCTFSRSPSPFANRVSLNFDVGIGYTNNPDADGTARGTYDVTGRLGRGSGTASVIGTEYTVSIDLRNINTSCYFVLDFDSQAGYTVDLFYIHRIWFS